MFLFLCKFAGIVDVCFLREFCLSDVMNKGLRICFKLSSNGFFGVLLSV